MAKAAALSLVASSDTPSSPAPVVNAPALICASVRPVARARALVCAFVSGWVRPVTRSPKNNRPDEASPRRVLIQPVALPMFKVLAAVPSSPSPSASKRANVVFSSGISCWRPLKVSSNRVAVSCASLAVWSATAANSGAMVNSTAYALRPASVFRSRLSATARNASLVAGMAMPRAARAAVICCVL